MEFAPSTSRAPGSGDDTFCRYLARQLIAKQGFAQGAPAEARGIAEQSDYVLYFTDGYSPIIIGLIDREANPGKSFMLSAMEVSHIGDACRALAGRMNTVRMPVTIHLMEVGAVAHDAERRLGYIKSSFFSKVQTSAWTIDPQQGAILTTAGYRARGLRGFIQKLLVSPREAVVMPEPVAVAPRGFPWLTAATIAVLAAIFAAEIAYGVGGVDRLKQPTITTLLAFGGLMGKLVTASGEWYRLFTAPLLHGGFEHIALNAVSLGLAGYVLEPLIGRAWLAALFVIGAIGGSLLSLQLNADNIVSVGASGAAMALFACMLVIGRHFPKGEIRTRLQTNAIYVLLPSLLPFASAAKGAKIDYAAHFGGAIAGVAVGSVLLALWKTSEAHPRLRGIAAAIAIAGLAVFVGAGALAQRNYPVYEISAAFAPPGAIPASDEAARKQSADLVARYPRDPRTQFMHAITLLRSGDAAGAEKALRAAIAEEDLWRRALTGGEISERIHVVLALVLVDRGQKDEAKAIARPACGAATPAQLRAALDQQKLCAD